MNRIFNPDLDTAEARPEKARVLFDTCEVSETTDSTWKVFETQSKSVSGT